MATEHLALAPGSLFTWNEDQRIVVKIGTHRNECLAVHACKSHRTFIDHRAYDTRTPDEIIIDSGCANVLPT